MYAWFYKGSHLLDLPIFTLLLFMVVFALVVVRTLREGNKALQADALLPLQDAPQSTVPNPPATSGVHHV